LLKTIPSYTSNRPTYNIRTILRKYNSSSGATQYTFDDADRLTGIVRKDTSGNNLSRSEYSYDGLNRLRFSRESTWQLGAWVMGAGVWRVYEGMNVVQERDGSGALLAGYTRGLDIGSGIGGLLAKTTSTGSFYYHYDGRGNVTQLTDGTGVTAARYRYDAFGNTLKSSGVTASSNHYRFSTKEYLDSSGLYDYGFRFYAPSLGKWINRDPIAEAGGINLYGFVANNPVNLQDAYGCAALADDLAKAVAAGLGALAMNLLGQLMENGWRWECIDWSLAFRAFIFGAIGGLVAGSPLMAGLIGAILNIGQTLSNLVIAIANEPEGSYNIPNLIAQLTLAATSGFTRGAIGSITGLGGAFTGGALTNLPLPNMPAWCPS
jgi:RHS repeat-associated protein